MISCALGLWSLCLSHSQPKVEHVQVHVHNNPIFCPHTEIVWFVYGTAGHLYFIVSVRVSRSPYYRYIGSALLVECHPITLRDYKHADEKQTYRKNHRNLNFIV